MVNDPESRRQQFIEEAYRLRGPGFDEVYREQHMQALGMEPGNHPHVLEYRALARYWEGRNCIRQQATGYDMISITTDGIRYVEEGEPTPVQLGTTINIGGNVYGSAVGTSGEHVQISNVFTFDDLGRLIEERGDDDREALHVIVRELREQLEEQDTLSRSWLSSWLLRHSAELNEHSWIVQPLATLLLAWGSGLPPAS